MYKKENKEETMFDFNGAYGVKLDENNRWVKKAKIIPWDKIEEKYAKLFPSKLGNVAKPLRMALGSLLIQKQYNYSDIELVNTIVENPYLQYFIGLKSFTNKRPYVPSLLVEFRKRLNEDILIEINEMILNKNKEEENKNDDSNGGTLVLDATCAPQNIAYPQDTNILNEARKDVEKIIDNICYEYNEERPRTYRIKAQKEFSSFAKSRKRTNKKVRKEIKALLQYLRRDLEYISKFKEKGYELKEKDNKILETIIKVYEQQKEMYKNKIHRCKDRIVSIKEEYVRPIVRGKVKAPVEFGAKIDLSIDEKGNARIEKLSFNPYNESEVLKDAVEKYKFRTGKYPERVLVDQIYRTKENINYCNERNIRISGVPLSRQNLANQIIDKKITEKDNKDRIEVERKFSLAKRKFGLGKIWTKLENTSRTSVVLSVIAMNIDYMAKLFFAFLEYVIFGELKTCEIKI